jgi:hypothetical protein
MCAPANGCGLHIPSPPWSGEVANPANQASLLVSPIHRLLRLGTSLFLSPNFPVEPSCVFCTGSDCCHSAAKTCGYTLICSERKGYLGLLAKAPLLFLSRYISDLSTPGGVWAWKTLQSTHDFVCGVWIHLKPVLAQSGRWIVNQTTLTISCNLPTLAKLCGNSRLPNPMCTKRVGTPVWLTACRSD